MIFQHGLIPVINKPTRVTKKSASSIDQRCFNVEIWLILRRDVAQPKHNVVSTLVFQRQIRNVETTLKQRWEKSFFST